MKRATLLIALAAGAVALTIATASSARTGSAADPKARVADFNSSITATVPPGGNATVTSPTLPADAERAKITIKPAKSEDEQLFEGLQAVLADAPTKGARILTCVFLAYAPQDGPLDFQEKDPTIAGLFFLACVRMALELKSQQGTGAAAAVSSLCERRRKAADAQITRSGSTYRMHVEGTSHKASRRSRLVTRCRERGTGVQLRLRPRSSRRTLREVTGDKLGIGLISPSGADRAVHVRTTFRAR